MLVLTRKKNESVILGSDKIKIIGIDFKKICLSVNSFYYNNELVMLNLNEEVEISKDVFVRLNRVNNKQVVLGFTAPKDIVIYRPRRE